MFKGLQAWFATNLEPKIQSLVEAILKKAPAVEKLIDFMLVKIPWMVIKVCIGLMIVLGLATLGGWTVVGFKIYYSVGLWKMAWVIVGLIGTLLTGLVFGVLSFVMGIAGKVMFVAHKVLLAVKTGTTLIDSRDGQTLGTRVSAAAGRVVESKVRSAVASKLKLPFSEQRDTE